MDKIRIGTRESKLAMVQAEMVQAALQRQHPGREVVLVPMKTTGDKILDRTLDKIGGKGLFVKELDRALLDGEADITVHSCKDLPMELDARLPVVAVSAPADVRDALVLPQGADTLDFSKPVGCSSARRRIQLQALYPQIKVEPVRGNVITRLQKLDGGQFSALILAAAGLQRLDLAHRIHRYFEPEEMLPAACQGILAVQARQDFDPDGLSGFNHPDTRIRMEAERAFVRALDGGCSKPCAAFAQVDNGLVSIRGMYVSDDETVVRYGTLRCEAGQATHQAAKMAERLKRDAER